MELLFMEYLKYSQTTCVKCVIGCIKLNRNDHVTSQTQKENSENTESKIMLAFAKLYRNTIYCYCLKEWNTKQLFVDKHQTNTPIMMNICCNNFLWYDYFLYCIKFEKLTAAGNRVAFVLCHYEALVIHLSIFCFRYVFSSTF